MDGTLAGFYLGETSPPFPSQIYKPTIATSRSLYIAFSRNKRHLSETSYLDATHATPTSLHLQPSVSVGVSPVSALVGALEKVERKKQRLEESIEKEKELSQRYRLSVYAMKQVHSQVVCFTRMCVYVHSCLFRFEVELQQLMVDTPPLVHQGTGAMASAAVATDSAAVGRMGRGEGPIRGHVEHLSGQIRALRYVLGQ